MAKSTVKEKVIGIDLGTTYSLAAYAGDDEVVIVENQDESTFIRSIVCIADKKIRVGAQAEALRSRHPEATIFSFKKFMGREFDKLELSNTKLPYSISKGQRNNVLLGPDSYAVSPEQLSAYVLRYIKELAEKILAAEVRKAVITTPAYFGDAQRQATKDAALIANLEPIRIMSEPTAAAVAYGLDQKKIGQVLVYDLGGGTFDVTVLKLKERVFRVIATNGDNNLGGDDFDQILIDMALKKANVTQRDLSAKDRQLLKVAAEKAKIELSIGLETDFSCVGLQLSNPVRVKILKTEFEKEIAPILQKTMSIIELALKDAKLKPELIDEVVLVGGSTRIPMVRQLITDYFGKTPNTRIDPDRVVAYGAAIQAHLLQGGRRDYLLMDVLPLSLGIETMGGVFSKLIMKNSSLPAKVTETFSTAVDNQNSVDINIYQGEREFIKDCRLVGKFKLTGIPIMPAGLPRIEVEFMVDQNGILTVAATELRSKVAAHISVVPEHGLTKHEINKMIEESIAFAFEDSSDRNLVELRQKAHNIVAAIDKSTEKMRQTLSQSEMQEIKAQKKLVESLLKEDKNFEKLTAELKVLQELTAEIADELISSAISQQLKS